MPYLAPFPSYRGVLVKLSLWTWGVFNSLVQGTLNSKLPNLGSEN